MTWKSALAILLPVLCSVPFSAHSQPNECVGNGVPGGLSWSICLHPWSPQEHVAFDLNFAGLSCTPYVHDQFDIQRSGNIYSIYYDHLASAGCFGVPSSPRLFTTQAGVPAGQYTVRLLQRRATALPFLPFDPAGFTLERELDFTVRGTPQATPVPAGGPATWMALIFALLALAVGRLRWPRKDGPACRRRA